MENFQCKHSKCWRYIWPRRCVLIIECAIVPGTTQCQDEFRNLSGCVIKILTGGRILQISIAWCQIEAEIRSFPTMYGKGGAPCSSPCRLWAGFRRGKFQYGDSLRSTVEVSGAHFLIAGNHKSLRSTFGSLLKISGAQFNEIMSRIEA